MLTVAIGAIANIILDPVFIFLLNMGVQGAALATIISQFISALWIFRFLTGEKPALKLRLECLKLRARRVLKIVTLGMSGFIMAITNSAVQITCNSTLQLYGGDLFVGAMTVINTIREVVMMPVHGITNSAQPVMGFNYGAGKNFRVRKAISFTSVVCKAYATFIWAIVYAFPGLLIQVFNSDPQLISIAIPSLRLYFFGFFMMSLQMSGQSVFVALGKSKQAIFFSLLRKAVIVIPLTLYLPRVYGLGTKGVFLAEPISNFLGGLACYITMLLTVFRRLKKGGASSTISAL
jgi:Na+-driven multidrug efflux pump